MMSSCSESVESSGCDETLACKQEWLLRLMRAMVREWADLSGEIAELGASLSVRAIAAEDATLIREMQAFDVLSQRAVSQFRLLDAICRELSADGAGGQVAFEHLIQQVPVKDIKDSLLSAVKGEEVDDRQEDVPPDDQQSVFWIK